MDGYQLLHSCGDVIWHTCWNNKGTLLATCGSDKTIKLWCKEGNICYRFYFVLYKSETNIEFGR